MNATQGKVRWLDRPLSQIGLGSAVFGGLGWASSWGEQDDSVSVATVRRAIDLGINWVDTAPVYGNGHAEEVVGKSLLGLSEAERPYVFTKCGLRWDDRRPLAEPARIGSPSSLKEELFASLRRLGLDYLDLYQVHWPPADGTLIEDVWATMQDFVREGWARAVGVCNYDVQQLERSVAPGPVQSVQLHLSLLHPERAADVVPWCLERDVPVLAFGALSHGLLGGHMTLETLATLCAPDWRASHPDFIGERGEANVALALALAGIAADYGISLSALAVAWVLAVPGVTNVILGARSPVQAADWPLETGYPLSDSAMTAITAELSPRWRSRARCP